jgi:NO-binding membrane sensor protein with MHYT domain
MVGTYDSWLVVLSVVVAVISSYVALALASPIAASKDRKTALYWQIGGGFSLGTGIWSMHFIGMLALRLPIPMSYDIPITLLSLLIAVAISTFALYSMSESTLSKRRLFGSGLLTGVGIISMHYTGMAAMPLEPPLRYRSLLVMLSFIVAVVFSLAALWSAFRMRMESIWSAFWKKAGSALVMGGAISGTHYIRP